MILTAVCVTQQALNDFNCCMRHSTSTKWF